MINFYKYIKIIFAFTYLTGRLSIVAHYTIGQEDKRDNFYLQIPQFSAEQNKEYLYQDKLTAAIIRNNKTNSFFAGPSVQRSPVSNNSTSLPDITYSGQYIDPPKLV